MVRKVSVLALAVATAAAAGGCRTRCGSGWFTSRGGDAPCQLTGSSGACVVGSPVGGSFPAGVPGTFVPGGGYSAPGGASELPPPQPADLIPRPGVPTQPFAQPYVAPGDGGANLLPAPKGGVPVGR